MKIRIRYILDIIAMALAIWALMAMMPSEAIAAAETPPVLDIHRRAKQRLKPPPTTNARNTTRHRATRRQRDDGAGIV